jgi:hypothetical protein
MANFAVIKDNQIINLIDAPDLQTAQEVTGLLCVEYDLANAPAIGDKFEETPANKVK